jgi:hypothetical protein
MWLVFVRVSIIQVSSERLFHALPTYLAINLLRRHLSHHCLNAILRAVTGRPELYLPPI